MGGLNSISEKVRKYELFFLDGFPYLFYDAHVLICDHGVVVAVEGLHQAQVRPQDGIVFVFAHLGVHGGLRAALRDPAEAGADPGGSGRRARGWRSIR